MKCFTHKDAQLWPKLYKKSSSGKISEWLIYVIDNVIYITHGYQGMKMQKTNDVIKVGKNIGRSNETTPHEQAVLEADSKWQKQIDRGYSEKIDEEKEPDEIFFPMLAQSYDKHSDKIKFPCFVQPKLDGLRATCVNGKFYSRARKPFSALKHLEEEIERLGLSDLNLDGEIYNHEFREDFEKIVSAAKREKTKSEHTDKIQYHVYDINIDKPFKERIELLREIFDSIESDLIQPVRTVHVGNEALLKTLYNDFLEQGFEGAMVRNSSGLYECRRSYNLQKVKQFQDDEFKIVGVTEGRGKLSGHAAAFVCQIETDATKNPTLFEAKLKGSTAFLKQCFEDHSLWQGKWLTVQYQGYTRKNQVPRFPVGLRIREDE